MPSLFTREGRYDAAVLLVLRRLLHPAFVALAIALLSWLASASSARAEPPAATGRTSALSWVRLPGAESCIAATQLAAAVEARLGRRVFVPPADAEVSVEASVAFVRETRSFRATFRVADRAGVVLGQREVEERVASCDALDDRFAFVLSVLIDPDASPLAVAPAPPVAAPAAPTPTPAPTAAPAPSPVPPPAAMPPPTPWRWLVGPELGAGAGLVPGIGVMVGAGAIVTPPQWPGLRARGVSFLPTSQRVEGVALAEVGLVRGELGVCPLQLRHAPVGLTGCLDGFLGRLSARGSGFPDSRSFDALVGGVALDVVAELAPTRGLLFTLSPSVLVPLSRANLSYEDAQGVRRTIFDLSAVGGSLSLGIAVGAR